MIYELIKNRIPFAFPRYGDGELALIEGREINETSQAYIFDEWTAPNYITDLGIKLKESLKHTEDNYYYGIPFHEPLFSKFMAFINNNILDANFFVNENWDKFNNFAWGEHILISRQNGTVESPPDCVNNWNILLDRLTPYLNKSGELFLFSAGPMSCIAIDWMWSQNPTNMYVDVGSAIDFKTKGRITRLFME